MYVFIKSVERGYKEQTDSTRVSSVTLIISFLETGNIYTFYADSFDGKAYAFFYFTLNIINAFIFYGNGRWKKIVKNDNPSILGKRLTLVYVVLSIIMMIVTYQNTQG
jgi:hypothetical protein